ncbi:MAG: hypothetical protein ACK40K_01760, partial [Raineya sp.]
GCSDAGFCTMGAMRPEQQRSKHLNLKINYLEFTQHFGATKFGDYILSYIADADFTINPKTTFHFKLPYTFVFNKMPAVNGLGDVSLSVTRLLLQEGKWQIAGTLGGKIPTNGNDLSHNGIPLPSYYQTSLGTYDLVAGVGVIYGNWLFTTGYQHAFNRTKNQFLRYVENGEPKNSFEGTEHAIFGNAYANSKELQRAPDVMLRVERNFRLGRFNAHLGLLNIYRTDDDEVTNFKGARVKVQNSKGLTINGLLGFGYRFSTHSAVKILFGRKISSKDKNPDGLNREYVNNISYEIRF